MGQDQNNSGAELTQVYADKADFLQAEAAYNHHRPDQSLILFTFMRIDRTDLKVSKEEVEASKRGENIQAPMTSDQYVLDDHDSLRLMLAIAQIRAAQGCKIGLAILRAAEIGSQGVSDANGATETEEGP